MTVPDAGLLLECKLKNPAGQQNLLRRSVEAFEASKRLTPKKAPRFLDKLFLKIGLGLIPEKMGAIGGTKIVEGGIMSTEYTLKNLANRIPMVAGRLKLTLPQGGVADPDPLTDLDFLLLYPNKTILSSQDSTPSYSYFSAKRASGKVEQTHGLFQNLAVIHPQSDGKWVQETNSGNVGVPVASCSIFNTAEGEQLNLVFQGLGVYDDYCLTLHSGKSNTGSLYVLKTTGDRVLYETSFMEPGESGEKELVAAGFDQETQETVGLLEICQSPPSFAIQHEDMQLKVRTLSMNAEVLKAIEQAESQYRVNSGGSSTEQSTNASEPNPLAAFEIITNAPATENPSATNSAVPENPPATNALDQPSPAVTNAPDQPSSATPAATNPP